MSLIKKWTPETVIELGCYYTNMPNNTYHAHDDSISKSTLDRFSASPYKFFNAPPMQQTKAMLTGSAFHAAVLEPEIFDELFAIEPDYSDCLSSDAAMKSWLKAAGQTGYSTKKTFQLIEMIHAIDPTVKIKTIEQANWLESHQETEIITPAVMEKVEGMKAAVMNNDQAAAFISADGYVELSGFSTNQETGINTRHRFDKLAKIDGEWWGVDLKKTQSVDDYELSRTINKYRYHVQDTFYSDQFQQITGKELAGFVFIFVEEEYPHMVAVKQLCDVSREIGKGLYQDDLNRFNEYKVGNLVAHNNAELEYISLPEYVMASFEQEIF